MLVLCKAEPAAPKAARVGLRSAAAGQRFALLLCAGLAAVRRFAGGAARAGEMLGSCHSCSAWPDGPCSFISSGCRWRFEFCAVFTMEVKYVVRSAGVKAER